MGLKLILVRHAHAGDRDDFEQTGKPDHLRPVSHVGVQQMRAMSRLLVSMQPKCDLILTSPYTRTVQTAEILSEGWGARIRETPSLEPGSALAGFSKQLPKASRAKVIAAVGHEPHLGMLASWLISKSKSGIEFSKGAACLLEFDDQVRAGAGTLRWFIGPKQLAKLTAGELSVPTRTER